MVDGNLGLGRGAILMVSTKDKKPWYRSRTWWLNIFSGVLALAAMPEVLAVIPPEWLKWIALGNVFGNMFMRSITAGGTSLK